MISLSKSDFIIITLHRMHNITMLLIGRDKVAWSVCECVSLLITTNPCKTAEPIEIPLGMWTCGGSSNHVLDGAMQTLLL